ncbi:hypothetical protein AVEN_95945-1 [Araneus ventricosus]|uniref:Peptidase M12A domain-containing protein n=1 Tax=Araneus ventricosus TaxID=182803 RepID=A0A4Y2K126_ARAVE|nr:hypothetical protein AVEN_95945-1 [Araneus ventricosus]
MFFEVYVPYVKDSGILEALSVGYKQNFEKNSADEVENGNITYDYNSIMHYGAHNFAKNRSIPTIITLKENVTIGQRDGFSEKDVAKILERYGCGKVESTKNLAQSTKNPVESTKNLAQSAKNPAQTIKDSVQSTNNPAQSTKNSAQLTKMTTLAIEKKTTGDWKSSSATAITRNIITKTTVIQKTTQTKNKGKALLSKLVTAICRLVAVNRKTTPSRTTLSKLASSSSKTTLRLSTKTKLAAPNRKPTPSHTTILAKSTPAYGSGHYRRYKRHEPQPLYISAEEDEEVEAPQIVDTLEAEVQSPLVVGRLEANKKFAGGRASADFDHDRYYGKKDAVFPLKTAVSPECQLLGTFSPDCHKCVPALVSFSYRLSQIRAGSCGF